jgi:hypothetical protein
MNEDGQTGGPPYWGKYRGKVLDNADPLNLGRIVASVPGVHAEFPSGWAMPCLPFGGTNMGFVAPPAIGANVWIEYEQGNPDRPIWSGCFMSPTDIPPIVLAPPYVKVLIQTLMGQSVILDDTPGVGGITLKTVTGEMFMMSALGITMQTAAGDMLSITPEAIILKTSGGGSIALTGPAVSINNGALGVL